MEMVKVTRAEPLQPAPTVTPTATAMSTAMAKTTGSMISHTVPKAPKKIPRLSARKKNQTKTTEIDGDQTPFLLTRTRHFSTFCLEARNARYS